MKRAWVILPFLLLYITTHAQSASTPDTVKTGIYVTSIHDIDFKQKEYTINLWLWLRYKNKDFDFEKYLELPQAKTVTKLYSTIDSSDKGIYMLMKLQCVMKDSWTIKNFPFDKQRLWFSIENSQYDASSLIFAADTVGKNFDPRFALRGWQIDSFTLSTAIKAYETGFGDPELETPHMDYSSFRVKVSLHRDATDLFWKMFLGMYAAFLISFICFFIHADNIDSRFGLSVGALFAVIGNKYVVESSMPEATSFTLVDALHGITLLFIFLGVTTSVYSLKLAKANKLKQANKFDAITGIVFLVLYLLINAYLINKAKSG
jgi:hypothetical protein